MVSLSKLPEFCQTSPSQTFSHYATISMIQTQIAVKCGKNATVPLNILELKYFAGHIANLVLGPIKKPKSLHYYEFK